MTAAEATSEPNLLTNYLRRLYLWRNLWLHVLLVGALFALSYYSADTWWNKVVLTIAQYVFYVGFGLYFWIGWIMLRRSDRIRLLPSVLFITICGAIALTLSLAATPGPMQPFWWLGLVWPTVGFPFLFLFFKLLRAVRFITRRIQDAWSGARSE